MASVAGAVDRWRAHLGIKTSCIAGGWGVLYWYCSEKTKTAKTQTPQTTIAKSHGMEDLWSLEGKEAFTMLPNDSAMLLVCEPRERLCGCGEM